MTAVTALDDVTVGLLKALRRCIEAGRCDLSNEYGAFARHYGLDPSVDARIQFAVILAAAKHVLEHQRHIGGVLYSLVNASVFHNLTFDDIVGFLWPTAINASVFWGPLYFDELRILLRFRPAIKRLGDRDLRRLLNPLTSAGLMRLEHDAIYPTDFGRCFTHAFKEDVVL